MWNDIMQTGLRSQELSKIQTLMEDHQGRKLHAKKASNVAELLLGLVLSVICRTLRGKEPWLLSKNQAIPIQSLCYQQTGSDTKKPLCLEVRYIPPKQNSSVHAIVPPLDGVGKTANCISPVSEMHTHTRTHTHTPRDK